jgi:hypothetical protein
MIITNILFIIIIILLLFINTYKLNNEMFDNNILNQDIPKVLNPYNSNNTMEYDPHFDDVILYKNDETGFLANQEMGLTKCIKDPKCICVEFGITGNAFCFPKNKTF